MVRKQLIEALAYPRTLIDSGLQLENCPHNGRYDKQDLRCHECDSRPECEWLVHNDEFVALKNKPEDQLLAALEFALLHMSAFVASAGHDNRSCRCESCQWIRDSQDLYDRHQKQDNALKTP
jgi:hypothetical protein